MKLWLETASEYAGRWELLNIYLHLWLLVFTVIVFVGRFISPFDTGVER